MAPTAPSTLESQILTSYLLHPVPLPNTTTFKQFLSFFPGNVQNSAEAKSEMKALYRSFQHQRALTIDAVEASISREVKRGRLVRREVVREKLRSESAAGLGGYGRGLVGGVEDDDDGKIERMLSGISKPTSHNQNQQQHSLETILPTLRSATATLESIVQELEDEAAELAAEIESTVSGLSDLRYGKMGNPALLGDVLSAFEGVESVCEGK